MQLPAYPRREDLLQFEVSAASDFRFYIDRTSLAVGKDGVVRYTLVARSPAGVDNVSREGIRCRTGVYRIYAFGRADGTWAPRTSEWRAVDARGAQRWHGALWREYFCPQRSPIRDAAEGIAALEGRR